MTTYQNTINKVLSFAKRADETAAHCTGMEDKLKFHALAKTLRQTANTLRLAWFDMEDMLNIPTVK